MQTAFDKNRETVFHEIYQNSFEQLFHFTLRLVGEHSTAEDIVQQCYLKFWQTDFEGRGLEDARRQLFTYTRNLVIDYRRKEYTRQRYLDQAQFVPDASPANDGTRLFQTKEAMQAIEAAIEDMPARRKEIYKLSRHEGLSHEEIADRLSISSRTVNNQIISATEFLKARLLHWRS